jgi:CubicO group peptidase (beta-lactamase class C family)
MTSVSKVFTLVALKQLVGKKLIALDRPLDRYMPDFKIVNPRQHEECNLQHVCQPGDSTLT